MSKKKITEKQLLEAIDLLDSSESDFNHCFYLPCKKHAQYIHPKIKYPDECIACVAEE